MDSLNLKTSVEVCRMPFVLSASKHDRLMTLIQGKHLEIPFTLRQAQDERDF
jgi:hypothetical protein